MSAVTIINKMQTPCGIKHILHSSSGAHVCSYTASYSRAITGDPATDLLQVCGVYV